MRIAHVQLDLGVHFKSIDKALVGQVRAGQAEGIHFDVVVVNETRSGYDKGVRYVKHRAVPPRLRRLSRRLGEGAFNGALTARLGVAAVEVTRPLPFLDAEPLRVREILAELMRSIRSGLGRSDQSKN